MGKLETTQNKSYIYYLSQYINEKIKVQQFCNIDLDNQYYELLEKGLEYGMTIREFWEGDIENFFVYQNAYYNKLHNQSHIQGFYFNVALNTTLGNILNSFSKEPRKPLEYPETNYLSTLNKNEQQDPINRENKDIKKRREEEIEKEFRKRMLEFI